MGIEEGEGLLEHPIRVVRERVAGRDEGGVWPKPLLSVPATMPMTGSLSEGGRSGSWNGFVKGRGRPVHGQSADAVFQEG